MGEMNFWWEHAHEGSDVFSSSTQTVGPIIGFLAGFSLDHSGPLSGGRESQLMGFPKTATLFVVTLAVGCGDVTVHKGAHSFSTLQLSVMSGRS